MWGAWDSLLQFEGSVGSQAYGNRFQGQSGWRWMDGATKTWAPGALCAHYATGNSITGNTFTDEKGPYRIPAQYIVEERTENGAHDNVIEPNTFNIPFEEDEDVAQLMRQVIKDYTKELTLIGNETKTEVVLKVTDESGALTTLHRYTLNDQGELVEA